MIADDEQHRKDCLRRHYEDMDIVRARLLRSELEPKGKRTTKSKIFTKRINCAKGFNFI